MKTQSFKYDFTREGATHLNGAHERCLQCELSPENSTWKSMEGWQGNKLSHREFYQRITQYPATYLLTTIYEGFFIMMCH